MGASTGGERGRAGLSSGWSSTSPPSWAPDRVARFSDNVGPALARLYDLDLVEEPGDLELYLALARRAEGPVLELGVGTGRLAVPLTEAGYRVTGGDVD